MRARTAQSALVFLGLAAAAISTAAQGFWLDVPFVRQEKDGCGAAAIAMVMQYWAKAQNLPPPPAADPHRIQQTLASKAAKGIFASAMEGYLKQAGFQVFPFKGEWTDLEEHLRNGRPLIVSLKPRKHSADLHYVVVAGLDSAGSDVFVNDPEQRKLLRIERAEFEKQWSEADNWTLLALPAQKK